MLGLIIKSFLWNDSEKARKSCKGIQRKQDSAAGRKNRMAFPSWFPAQLLRTQAFKDVHVAASGTLVYHSDGLIVGVCWGGGHWIPKRSPLYLVLLNSTKLIKAGWTPCKYRAAQTCFSLSFLKTAWLCNRTHTSLACVVRGIMSSLKINLNRPNLTAAFVCNLIKEVMNVSQVFFFFLAEGQ